MRKVAVLTTIGLLLLLGSCQTNHHGQRSGGGRKKHPKCNTCPKWEDQLKLNN